MAKSIKRASKALALGLLTLGAAAFQVQAEEPQGFIFGVGTHHGMEPDYFYELRQAGVMSNRDDFSWGGCEKEKGVIKFSDAYGKYVDRCLENGLSTICILDYGNKFYDEGGYPRSAEAIEGFARYSEAVVKELKGKIKLYQVWNEWDGGCGMKGKGKGDPESYVKLLSVVYPRIKAIDPDCIVMANSVCTGDAFLKKTVELGVLKHCDAVALHTYFYGDPKKTLENHWYPRMIEMDKYLKEANGGKEFPLYATEIGFPTQVDNRGCTESYSADCMAKLYLLAISLPYIKGVWWYDFRDDGWDWKYNENNFGMVRQDMTPKLPYFVFRDLTRYLKGATFVERIDVKDPQVWVMKYKKADGKTVLAAWSEYKDIDIQISFSNAATAAPEVSVCNLGYGSLQRTFVKGSGSVPKLSVIVRARPWVLEGDLAAAKVEGLTKREFPESARPTKVQVKSPAAIGKAVAAASGKPAPVYQFGSDANYRCVMETKRGGKADLDASFSMRWEKTRLFLTVNVSDDVFSQDYDRADTWNGDGIQFAFHALGPDAGNMDHADFDVALTKDGAKAYCQGGPGEKKAGPAAELAVKAARDGAKTVYEIEIPVAAAGLPELQPGTAFGFSVLVNDNDGKGRKGYLRWGDGIGMSKDPSEYNWIMAEE